MCCILCFRNLRRQTIGVLGKTERKKNRRKKKRDDPQGPRVTKQHRRQHIKDLPSVVKTDHSSVYPTSGHSSSPAFEGWSEQEMDDPADTPLTVELISSSVTLEPTTKPRGVQPKRKAPKKTARFRDLLTQMHGNSSMIVRETR